MGKTQVTHPEANFSLVVCEPVNQTNYMFLKYNGGHT